MQKLTRTTIVTFSSFRMLSLALVTLLSFGMSGCSRCSSDEAPPSLPKDSAPRVPPAETPLVPDVADSAPPAPSASVNATPSRKGSTATLLQCCQALAHNAKLAPPPNDSLLRNAATTCEAMVKAGNEPGAVREAVRAASAAAPIPLACR
jgi:hypothetical protein